MRPFGISLCLLMAGAALSCAQPRQVHQHDTASAAEWASHFTNEPIRGETRPLMLHVDGDTFECSTCHDGFAGDMQQEALEGTHADIEFDHGMNLRCLNCHNPENSDTFVSHEGSEIPGDRPTELCAKCHGPHYRDWSIGVHGRVGGSWNSESGLELRLDCIQCHNPHRPRFQPMAPAPANPLTRFDRHITRDTTKDGDDHDASG